MSFPSGNWINRVFYSLLTIDFPWCHQKSKAVSHILRQLIPEGSGRLGSHGYDVNFIFRPFKRRHTLHDSTLKVQRLWINEQLNHRIPNSTGVTNNATNTPWQLWRWTTMAKGLFQVEEWLSKEHLLTSAACGHHVSPPGAGEFNYRVDKLLHI